LNFDIVHTIREIAPTNNSIGQKRVEVGVIDDF
jgi:hypothetical protein